MIALKTYFNGYLIIVIYLMNFMNFDFIFEFYLLQCKKICTLKLIVALNFLLLRHDICLQGFFLPSSRWISIQRKWVARLTQFVGIWFFFNLHLNWTKCSVYLTNLFCLLKRVRQNSYLDLWSNTLSIIWQGVHILVKLQARGTNK